MVSLKWIYYNPTMQGIGTMILPLHHKISSLVYFFPHEHSAEPAVSLYTLRSHHLSNKCVNLQYKEKINRNRKRKTNYIVLNNFRLSNPKED